MKNWFMQVFGMHALGCGLVLSAFVAAMPISMHFVESSTRLASFGYAPYGPLATCFPSEHARIQNGRYHRDAADRCGYRLKAYIQNTRTGEKSKIYSFADGEAKTMSIPLSANRKDHYTIVVETGPYEMLSGGVWTPLYGSWYWPTKSNPNFQACSQNPLKVKALLNLRTSTLNGPWQLADHTAQLVKPGGYACVHASQPHHTYRKVLVSWNNGKHIWKDGYEVVARY